MKYNLIVQFAIVLHWHCCYAIIQRTTLQNGPNRQIPPKSLPAHSIIMPNKNSQPAQNQSSRNPSNNLLKNEWIGNGHLQFTFDLLSGIFMNSLDIKTGNLESVAFSPFSIQSILMMMHLGAKGITKSEIARVLHLESSENNVTFSKSHEAFGQAIKSLLDDFNVAKSLQSANQIFVQENLQMSNTYSLALAHYHLATIKHVNFAKDSYQVLNMINEWIEKHTQHMITNFLTNPPSPMTSIMAVNAIRFKGDWQYRFDPTDTEKDAWFRMFNGQTAKVDMMVGQLPVAFAHNPSLQTTIIELPFKTSRLSFFFLLPDETFGLFSLLKSLNSTVFANLIYSMRKVNNLHSTDKQSPSGVNIRIPKFSINSMPRITQILKNQLGLKSLFSNEDSNLEAMFNRPVAPIHMDELLHKAVLKVDEYGSVGAAVSTSNIERVGAFNGPYFEADHPFVFLLMDKQTGLALFSGIYSGPNNNNNAKDNNKSPVYNPSNNNQNLNFVNANNGKINHNYGMVNFGAINERNSPEKSKSNQS